MPVREVVFGLLAAKNNIVPLPAPELPAVTEIQLTSLDAVQAHPAGAKTEIDPLKPPETAVIVPTLMLYVHANPDCVIVNEIPRTVIVPVRAVAPVFAATE